MEEKRKRKLNQALQIALQGKQKLDFSKKKTKQHIICIIIPSTSQNLDKALNINFPFSKNIKKKEMSIHQFVWKKILIKGIVTKYKSN